MCKDGLPMFVNGNSEFHYWAAHSPAPDLHKAEQCHRVVEKWYCSTVICYSYSILNVYKCTFRMYWKSVKLSMLVAVILNRIKSSIKYNISFKPLEYSVYIQNQLIVVCSMKLKVLTPASPSSLHTDTHLLRCCDRHHLHVMAAGLRRARLMLGVRRHLVPLRLLWPGCQPEVRGLRLHLPHLVLDQAQGGAS